VDEEIDSIRKYNNTGSETVHYLVSDARRKSVIIECFDGQVHAHRNVEPWQAVTNFMIGGAPPDSLLGHCERYAAVYSTLHNYHGLINKQIGMDILGSVARYVLPVGDGRYIYTVWSAIYDLTRGGLNFNNSPRPSKNTSVRYYLSKRKIIDGDAIFLTKRILNN
jgi:hypothetical protein